MYKALMKNHIVTFFLILCLSSAMGQDFLSVREQANRHEKVEMEANTAEAIFIAATADLTITTSNKSVDLAAAPVKQDDGR